jgi:glycosyltransferase involved in cell wall biosynthesis
VERLLPKVRVVHPSVQRQFLHAAEEVVSAPVPASDRILFFGALNEGKGALVFLDALAESEAVKKGSPVAVIGGFTEKNPAFARRWNEAVEALRNSLAPGQLELLGKVTSFEVIRQIKLARVVVIPSLFDAFSRALVETLILGRPVVTTDRVGAAPLVKAHDCGLVVPAGDAGALARAIDLALSPNATYAENARLLAHRLLHEFSPDAIARQIAQHLSEIVPPPPK